MTTKTKCDECGAGNCKLWQEYPVPWTVRCAPCAAAFDPENVRDISTLDENGTIVSKSTGMRNNSIGWFTPCYSTEYDFSTEEGYRSAVAAWRALPSLPEKAAA